MIKVLVVYNKAQEQDLKEIVDLLMNCLIWGDVAFEKLIIDPEINDAVEPKKIISSQTDIIVSFDMAGMKYKTLLENYLYNIVPKKQMHILVDGAKWNLYCEEDFAWNLFIYVAGDIEKNIQNNFENPNIKYYSSKLLKKKGNLIDEVLLDFMTECGLR